MTAPAGALDEILAELKPALRARMAELAEALLGPPNRATRARPEWRWGKRGSLRVFVSGPKTGACADFESCLKGDALSLIMWERHCDFIAAVRFAYDFVGIAFDRQGKPEDQAKRAAREAEQARMRAEREADAERDAGKRIAYARRLWNASKPIDGTVAETYLITERGIPRRPPARPVCARRRKE